MENLEQKVLDLIKNNPMKGGEIAEKLGVDKKDIDKVIKQLKSGDKIESPKRCYYQSK